MEETTVNTWDSFAIGAKQFLNDIVFQYVPKLIMAGIVLFVGWKLINLLNKVMQRAYDRNKVDPSLQQFLHSLIDIILKVLLVITAMGIMGIQMTSFIAILGAAGVAIGMGLQGTLQNFAGGVSSCYSSPSRWAIILSRALTQVLWRASRFSTRHCAHTMPAKSLCRTPS